ncbi:LLM class F420-dependent oxidoreductase [Actinocrispum sp. NPDC049592]|uniref:LLM class F420-dependent oxidoreductase n=1 Tax=Actinocrispum sp. NPDC049592 TaxID=3154835 RepID=UPI00341AD23E
MKISTQLMYAGNPKELIEHVVALENAGLDTVWVAEAYGFDSPTLMGYIAAKTSRVQIGSAILPIYSRTPALIAQTAAGLDAVSGGRAILGLGASGPQVIEGWHGVAYDKPLGRTREVIDICRRIWRREVITNTGNYNIPLPEGQGTGLGKPLKILTHPVRPEIPIYVASLGDKNVQMTAEIADGWLPTLFIPEKAQSVWGQSLAAGKQKRDPALGELEIVAGGMLAIGDDVTGLRDASRPYIALYVGGMGARGRNFYNDLAKRYGFEAEAEKIQELYLAGKKDEAAAAVPAEFAELTNLIGPAGYVKERLQAFKEAGVTSLNVTPIGENPVALIEQIKEWLA